MQWIRAIWMSILELIAIVCVSGALSLLGFDFEAPVHYIGFLILGGILIPAIFSIWYFNSSSISPSAASGFYFGLIPMLTMIAITIAGAGLLGTWFSDAPLGTSAALGARLLSDPSTMIGLLHDLLPYVLIPISAATTAAILMRKRTV